VSDKDSAPAEKKAKQSKSAKDDAPQVQRDTWMLSELAVMPWNSFFGSNEN